MDMEVEVRFVQSREGRDVIIQHVTLDNSLRSP